MAGLVSFFQHEVPGFEADLHGSIAEDTSIVGEERAEDRDVFEFVFEQLSLSVDGFCREFPEVFFAETEASDVCVCVDRGCSVEP